MSLFFAVADARRTDRPGGEIRFGPSVLERRGDSAARNPYLVAHVDEALIADHNDIDDPRIIASQSPEREGAVKR